MSLERLLVVAEWVCAGRFLFREFLPFSASDMGDYFQASVMMVLQGGCQLLSPYPSCPLWWMFLVM